MERVDHALDLHDGRNISLPFRPDDDRRCVKHGNGSDFVAIAPLLVDGLNTGTRQGCIASGLDYLTQSRLIVFELNDQMRVREGGGLKSFFDSGARRR